MWSLIAEGTDEAAVQAATHFAESQGLSVRVISGYRIELATYLRETHPHNWKAGPPSWIKHMNEKGLIILGDLARRPFERFLKITRDLICDREWLTQELLELMVANKATFTDADPAEFISDPITQTESSRQRVLAALGITSWKMFPYISLAFLQGVPSIGPKHVGEIRKGLKARGLRLKGE